MQTTEADKMKGGRKMARERDREKEKERDRKR